MVPNQNYGEGIEDLHGLHFQERLAVLQLLKQKPTVRRVKELQSICTKHGVKLISVYPSDLVSLK